MELIQWKELSHDYEKELKSGPLATGVFSENTEKGNKRWADLKNRVAEHVRIKFLITMVELNCYRVLTFYNIIFNKFYLIKNVVYKIQYIIMNDVK